MTPQKAKPLILSLALAGLAGSLLLYWLAESRPSAPRDSRPAAVPEQAEPTPVAATAMPHRHDHGDLLEALSRLPATQALLKTETRHFETPERDTPTLYAQRGSMPSFDRSCDARASKPDATRTLEAQLATDYATLGRERVPRHTFYEDVTQFFQLGTRYFQLSARALPASRPPRYQFEFYSADDPRMQTGLLRQALPVAVPAILDAPAVAQTVEAALRHYLDQGASEGARLLQVRISGNPGQDDQEIKFLNGDVVQWSFGSGLCQAAAVPGQSICRCLPDGEQLRIPAY